MEELNDITHPHKKQSVWGYRVRAWQWRGIKSWKNSTPFEPSSLVLISLLILHTNKSCLCFPLINPSPSSSTHAILNLTTLTANTPSPPAPPRLCTVTPSAWESPLLLHPTEFCSSWRTHILWHLSRTCSGELYMPPTPSYRPDSSFLETLSSSRARKANESITNSIYFFIPSHNQHLMSVIHVPCVVLSGKGIFLGGVWVDLFFLWLTPTQYLFTRNEWGRGRLSFLQTPSPLERAQKGKSWQLSLKSLCFISKYK